MCMGQLIKKPYMAAMMVVVVVVVVKELHLSALT